MSDQSPHTPSSSWSTEPNSITINSYITQTTQPFTEETPQLQPSSDRPKHKHYPEPAPERDIKRRQRASLVCVYCKKRKIKCDRKRPRCTACLKFSRECSYSVSWIQQSAEAEPKPKNSASTKSANKMTKSAVINFSSQTTKEMTSEIQLLKEKLSKLEDLSRSSNESTSLSDMTAPNTSSVVNRPQLQLTELDKMKYKEYLPDFIDFYENYNSLTLKASSHEDLKVLNPFAVYKLDHYYAFFSFFFFFYIHISRKVMEDMAKDDWKSKHPDGGSKWLSLLGKDPEDQPLREFGAKISTDRAIAKSANLLPFISLDFSSKANPNSAQTDAIQSQIIEILPPFAEINSYLDLFFDQIWPLRPFVNESSFRKDISRIVKQDPATGLASRLDLSQRSDMALISQLLIILRYSYVALHVMNNSDINAQFLNLAESTPISVNFISMASACLSFYKILKKTTLPMLQAMLLLRYYYRDSPEDGDGISLCQSQQLSGFILQSALNMGLNRDPTNYVQFDDDSQIIDLRRRLWFGITKIENYSVISNGSIHNLPDDDMCDVRFPLLDKDDPLFVAQYEEYQKSSGLEQIYIKISKLVNRVSKTNVAELIKLVSEASEYISANYRLQENDPYLKLSNSKRFRRLYCSIGYSNSMCLSKMLVQNNLESQVYALLTIHYGTTKYSDYEKYFHCLVKQFGSAKDSFDLSLGLVLGKFKTQIPDIHSFHLNPLANYCLFRSVTILISLTLQIYHAQEILEVPAYSENSSIQASDLNALVEIILQQCDYATHILRETLGLKYWSTLKALASMKYRTAFMRKHKFSFMENIIDFLDKEAASSDETVSKTKGKIRDRLLETEKGVSHIIRQWIRVDISTSNSDEQQDPTQSSHVPKKTSLIINMNHANHFVNITKSKLNEIYQLINSDFKYIPEFKHMMVLYSLQSSHQTNSSDPITTAFNDATRPNSRFEAEPIATEVNADLLNLANFDFNFLELLDGNDDIFKSLFTDTGNSSATATDVLADAMSFDLGTSS
ncbi:hypothetical protein WICPIJ_004248 [Wickerhamomyces pijperi]|uniref:Zn(2)-C6 fungal-type domain-containing protein n=1 Tax=Wickerhamomyces pijperi TaxID=599730 RepID=A0A9P8TN39_WICPI|nr:hypothetical protein WICPIJ_004248 [Wickerhamomyces pijperi]